VLEGQPGSVVYVAHMRHVRKRAAGTVNYIDARLFLFIYQREMP